MFLNDTGTVANYIIPTVYLIHYKSEMDYVNFDRSIIYCTICCSRPSTVNDWDLNNRVLIVELLNIYFTS